jgi:hypothetical protein
MCTRIVHVIITLILAVVRPDNDSHTFRQGSGNKYKLGVDAGHRMFKAIQLKDGAPVYGSVLF